MSRNFNFDTSRDVDPKIIYNEQLDANLLVFNVIEIKAGNQEILNETLESNLDEGESASPSKQAVEKGPLETISDEFSTFKDSHTRNKTMQEDENVEKNSHLNMQEDESLNNNFSKSFEDENTDVLISCSKESKDNIRCVEDIAAIPGPSHGETFKCSICEKEPDQHVILHEGNNVYQCCRCRKGLTSITDFIQHNELHRHASFVCGKCVEFFEDNDSHETEKTCNICQETFTCMTFLLEHSRTHREYCVICWKEIDEHKSQYTGLYECCKCELKTEMRTNMWIHFYTHFKERTFRCDKCRKRYATAKSLRNHKKRKHGKQ